MDRLTSCRAKTQRLCSMAECTWYVLPKTRFSISTKEASLTLRLQHSNAAHNLLSTMRVGVIRGGCEVEIWKKAQREGREQVVNKDGQGQKIIRAGDQVTKVEVLSKQAGAA